MIMKHVWTARTNCQKETKYQMTTTSPDKMPTNHLAFCDCLLAFCPTTDGSWWGIFRLDLAKPAWMILANFGEEVGWDKSQPVCSALPPSAPPSICCVQPWPGQDTLSPRVKWSGVLWERDNYPVRALRALRLLDWQMVVPGPWNKVAPVACLEDQKT